KASALIIGEAVDTTCRVVEDHPVLLAKFEDSAKHSYSSGRNTSAAGSTPASAFSPTRPGGLARRHVRLKTLDVAARKPCDRAPADQRFDVAFNATAIHRQRGRLNSSLGVRHV